MTKVIIIFLAFDLVRLAFMGINEHLYDAAIAFFDVLIPKSIQEKASGIETIDHLFGHKVDPEHYMILLNTTKKVHDHKLDKKGQFGREWRCNQYPYDPELQKKKKFENKYNATIVLNRATTKYFMSPRRNQKDGEAMQISTQLQVDKLCRGGQLRVRQYYHIIKGKNGLYDFLN